MSTLMFEMLWPEIVSSPNKAPPGLALCLSFAFMLGLTCCVEFLKSPSNGEPYEVPTPETRYVFVSDPKHIQELDDAPDAVLSLQAAARHMLQPKYTMHGFSWFDLRGAEGFGVERVIRTLLTNFLPEILPDVSRMARVRMEKLLPSHTVIGKGGAETSVFGLMKELVAHINAYVLFGKELCDNDTFMRAASTFMDQTLVVAEIIRLVPRWAVPFIGKWTSTKFDSDMVMYSTLISIIERRLEERNSRRLGQRVPKHASLVSLLAERVAWELMAIWFGACYSLSVTSAFTIQDLCRHSDHIPYLRAEIEGQYHQFEATGKGLPLLDSFLKESARQHPVESMSTRRHAVKPFTFSDGTRLDVGDWACTPVHAINHNPSYYPDPMKFDGFRFADAITVEKATIPRAAGPSQLKPSDLTEVSSKWQFWGTGRMACPGRFYATMTLKVIISQILANYDCTLPMPEAKSLLTWRSTFFPRESFKVSFTPRNL
ncbi:cytochrome P450 [Nemania abortiva]|nr:cytochrome P450 [Nemania abortiva]